MDHSEKTNGTSANGDGHPKLPIVVADRLNFHRRNSPKRQYREAKRVPFPLDAIVPSVLAEYVRHAAVAAGGCEPAMIAGPMFSVLAAAVGPSFYAAPTDAYIVAPPIWVVVACRRGSNKSSALDFAVLPLREIHARLMKKYQKRQREYERLLGEKVRTKANDPSGPRPPRLSQAVLNDATPESIVEVAFDNPKPPLATKDELAALLVYGKYGAGSSAEAERCQWLEGWGGRDLTVNRKISGRRVMYVPNFCISLTGTIQVETMHELMSNKGNKRSGLRDRLLVVFAERRLQRISRQRIPDELVHAYRKIVRGVYRLPVDRKNGPKKVFFSEEAQELFDSWHDAHAQRQDFTLDEDEADLMAKTRSYASRFALVMHCASCVHEGVSPERPMAKATVQAGITIAEWFEDEMKRFYGNGDGDPDQRKWDNILRIVRQAKDGAIDLRSFLANQRNLHRGRRDRMSRDEFKEFIQPLIEARRLKIEMRSRQEWLVATEPSEWPDDLDDTEEGEIQSVHDQAHRLTELWLTSTSLRRGDGSPVETHEGVLPQFENMLENLKLSYHEIAAEVRSKRDTGEWVSALKDRLKNRHQEPKHENQQRSTERFGPA